MLALGAVLLALLAVVAAASRAHHIPGGHAGVHQPPAGVGDYVFSIAAVFFAAMFLFFLYLWFSERDLLAQKRRQKRGTSKALIFIIGAALIISLVARVFPDFGRKRQQQARARAARQGQPAPKHKAVPGQPNPPQFQWLPVFVATAAGLVLLGVIGVRRIRRDRLGLLDQHLLELELEQLLDDTLADLYAMTDPREAIIAAYGRMERLFASYGLPRDPSEAPVEYLRRALGELRASGSALRRLTELYQSAKFSTHEVDPAMRDDAIHALTLVRDELKANRTEDEARRAESDRIQGERAADASEDRTYGEDPFATVGDKVRGDPYSGGR